MLASARGLSNGCFDEPSAFDIGQGELAMKRVALCIVLSAGVAAFFNGPVLDPANWALVLAGVAGGGLFVGRPKPPIGIDG